MLGHWTGARNQIKARAFCSQHGAYIPARSMAALPKQRRASCAKQNQKQTRANGKYAKKRCKKHSKKGDVLFPLCSTLAVPGKCARVHQARRARDLFSLDVQNHCSTRKEKGVSFTHSNEDKATCSSPRSNVLQARGLCCNTHTAHEFCTIGGRVTGAGKDGLCTKHGAFGLCTLNTCSTAVNRRRIVRQAWRWQHSSVQP